MPMVRQGDVLLIPAAREAVTASHVARARDDGAVVLARGELTGHAHAIHDAGATLFVAEGEADAILVVEGGAVLVHEEHAAIPIAPGRGRVLDGLLDPEHARHLRRAS